MCHLKKNQKRILILLIKLKVKIPIKLTGTL